MTELKRCKQCGMLKEVSEYRQYTYSKEKNTQGHFSICKTCENINQKYRNAKAWLKEYGSGYIHTESHSEQMYIIETTEALYELLRANGLHPAAPIEEPLSQMTEVEKLMHFYGVFPEDRSQIKQINLPVSQTIIETIPLDLKYWLDSDTAEWQQKNLSPEYLQDTVYESLKAKYRPQIGFDTERGLPVYDNTYKEVLNSVLHRFDDYEEQFAGGTDELNK